MKFCQENSEDIKKYFQGSFIKFPQAGEVLHYVDRVEGHSIRGKLFAPDETGKMVESPFIFHLNPMDATTPDVEFILPRKSYFNHNGEAHLLFRIPARQYSRGVTAANTAVFKLEFEDHRNLSLTFERLTAYVGKQAFLPFADRGNSYAVSRRVAVSGDASIFVDQTRIGCVDYEKQTITVLDALFVSELQRLVQEHGQQYEVKMLEATPRKKRAGKGYTPPKAVDAPVEIVQELE
jgi:hypothetical protein